MSKHPEKNEHSKKIQVYLTAFIIVVMIFAAWLLNLKNSLKHNLPAEEKNITAEIKKISSRLEEIIIETQNQKNDFPKLSAPTSSASSLQDGPQISPDQLDTMLEKIKIETNTTTPIATSTDFSL